MAELEAVQYKFVNGLPDDFTCPVCLDAVYGAKQTNCCGHHLCQTCSDRLTAIPNSSCPLCKATPLNTHEDRYFRRKLNDLKVYCPNMGKEFEYDTWEFYPYAPTHGSFIPIIATEECNAQCELRDIQSHLDTSCPLQPVTCKYKCGTEVRRCELERHQTEVCRMRPHKCDYCSHQAKAYEIEEHYRTCPEVPVKCPHWCSAKQMKRSTLEAHLSQECPLQPVSCEFAHAGCKEKPLRKEYEKHIEESTQSHLRLLASYCAEKDREIERLKADVEKLKSLPHKCLYCSHQATVYELDKHYSTCPEVPVECPRGCSTNKIPRSQLKDHLKSCPNSPFARIIKAFTGTK